MEISLAKGNKTGANAVQKWKFLSPPIFSKKFKKGVDKEKELCYNNFRCSARKQ